MLLSPGAPDKFIGDKIISKSLLRMRLARQIKDAGGNEVRVCSLRGLLFRTDEDIVNTSVV